MPVECRDVSERVTIADIRIEAIRKSGGRLGEVGIPEMIDYLRKIGYKVCSLVLPL